MKDSWKYIFGDLSDIYSLVDQKREEYSKSKLQIFPSNEYIFRSLNYFEINETNVVIIGQDPYHQQRQANGLSFSVTKDVKIPPSLNNIFKELNNDVNKPLPSNGDLTYLSNQGVLLLNSCLSVRMSSPGSHYNFGWETFTDKIISIISKKKSNVVFLLWGNKSISKSKLIDTNKHLILTSGHPSPLSANRGYWFGNRHFSKTNEYLKRKGLKKISW